MTGRSGHRALISRSSVSPSIPGMLMSDRMTINCGSMLAVEKFERFRGREGEMEDVGPLPRLAAKPLAEQVRDIGLVVDDEDAYGHDASLRPSETPAPHPRRSAAADVR